MFIVSPDDDYLEGFLNVFICLMTIMALIAIVFVLIETFRTDNHVLLRLRA